MFFRKLALKTAQVVGSGPTFLAAVAITILWLGTGPYFHFSNTWQLVINTTTSVATFLIVFLIQNTQNRDTAVIQMKLDELIRAIKTARTELVQMEGLTDEQLESLRDEFRTVRERAATGLEPADGSKKTRE